MKKRLLASLLALCMLAALPPGPALADTAAENAAASVTIGEATANYATIEAAWTAAAAEEAAVKAGQKETTLTLTASVETVPEEQPSDAVLDEEENAPAATKKVATLTVNGPEEVLDEVVVTCDGGLEPEKSTDEAGTWMCALPDGAAADEAYTFTASFAGNETWTAASTGCIVMGDGTVKDCTNGHTWGTAWASDAAGHWRVCSVCSKANAFAAHTPGGWIVDTAATATTAGSRHRECTVCHYHMAVETIPADGGPAVSAVVVAPATASVAKGGTQRFTATVTGENAPAQAVTWSVTGAGADGTAISADGTLTVALGETAQTLTVKAVSTADAGKSGTAVVTVNAGPGISDPEPGDDPGTPGDNPGTPGDDPGTPGDDPGTPGDDPGTPGDDPGTPGDDPGTPGDDPGTPNGSGGSGGGSSGGSTTGGSGGSTTGGSTEAATNPDGSTTTRTENKATGTVTETTKYPDGSQVKVETRRDGTVTTTETDAAGNRTETVSKPDGSSVTRVEQKDGATATVNTGAGGRVEAEVSLPWQAVREARRGEKPIVLPIPAVKAGASAGTAPVVTVRTSSEEPVKVLIPLVEVKPGTVAVLLKDGGAGEIIKASVPTGDGLAVPLPDGATVKLVDNSRRFADVPADSWAADAVSFGAARELFAGTAPDTFSPEEPMTRAMLVTVLARFYGVDTSGGSTWYVQGVDWAVSNGISDGRNMAGNVSREQLAVMLWRCAGSPASAGDLSGFRDGDAVSAYAREAMCWAVEKGIISGFGNGLLGPQAQATRAQAAQMLQNFICAL